MKASNRKIGIILCAGLLLVLPAAGWLWVGPAPSGKSVSSPLQNILAGMKADISEARLLIQAGMDNLIILDESNHTKEYRYQGQILWCNGSPLITGIQAMHFEYRDRSGNLLKRFDSSPGSVYSVSCVLRMSIDGRESQANTQMMLLHSGTRLQNPDAVAWAYSADR